MADYHPADLGSAPQVDVALENEWLRLENRNLNEERHPKKATQFFARKLPDARVYRCLEESMVRCDPLAGSCASANVTIVCGVNDRTARTRGPL